MLTLWATGSGVPSASLWDTLTFSGLPAAGAVLTETFTLTGNLTGSAQASARIQVGADYANPQAQGQLNLSSATPLPTTLSVPFTAYNGVPLLFFAALYGNNGAGSTLDLLDPPTFSITVPQGVSYTSASGVFGNVGVVPEPAPALLLLLGLAGMGWRLQRQRGRR